MLSQYSFLSEQLVSLGLQTEASIVVQAVVIATTFEVYCQLVEFAYCISTTRNGLLMEPRLLLWW